MSWKFAEVALDRLSPARRAGYCCWGSWQSKPLPSGTSSLGDPSAVVLGGSPLRTNPARPAPAGAGGRPNSDRRGATAVEITAEQCPWPRVPGAALGYLVEEAKPV
jgi:hypothetical protein